MEFHGPFADVDIPDVTLYDLIFADIPAADLPRPAIIHEETGQVLTFDQMRRDVCAVAAWLAQQHVGVGRAVAILLPNCPEHATAFHGILRSGAAVAPINVAYTADEIAHLLNETNAAKVVTCTALLPQAAAAVRSVGLDPADVIVVGLDPDSTAGHVDYTELLACAEEPPVVDIDPATHVACLPSSSGTTGLPKAVMLSHRNLVANVVQFGKVLEPLTGDQRLVSVLPFSHIFALSVNLNFGLYRRWTQLTMSGFAPIPFLELVQKHRATWTCIVPPIAAFLAGHPVVAKYDLSSLQLLVSGAAPLDGVVGRRVQDRLKVKVLQGYGMTELSPVTHVIPMDRPDIDLGTIGPAIPNVRFRVVDPNTGTDVEVPEAGESEPGEMWCKGPNAMLGYLGRPAETAAVLDPEGWVHTGDLVRVDKEGVVRVVDRIKELIKYRGLQIAPAELEAVLCQHPAVQDAAVLGVAHHRSRGDQFPHALVALKPGQTATGQELREFVAERVAKYKHIKSVSFVDKIPRSAAGKILRRELDALLPEGLTTQQQ